MPRQMRIEYPGAIYHVMSRGDQGEPIFLDQGDRHDFLKTLGEACAKNGFAVHAYCLMRNPFHLVVETPGGNLVDGMRWLLSTYSNRFNHRHELCGHLFSGRYKALVVDGSGRDTEAGRREFERRMESRRAAQSQTGSWKGMRRGWCLGSEAFMRGLMERLHGQLGPNHAGEMRRQANQARAEGIIAGELKRLRWKPGELSRRAKNDPGKLAMAARLRRETTLPLKWIAQRAHLGADRLQMGSRKSVAPKLHVWKKANE